MGAKRPLRAVVGAVLVALLAGVLAPLATFAAQEDPIAMPSFADPAFRRVWDRYDHPVYFGDASRSYTWGASISAKLEEPFKEGPSGKHIVQYFDKSRMEINDPNGNQNDPFFVTQGLLARDMIRGEVQEGVNTFRKAEPAQVPFGDPDDKTGPTYASLTKVLDAPAVEAGQPITAAIDRAGNVANTADSRGVTSLGILPEITTKHSIASVFYNFVTQAGVIYENGQNVTASLYNPWFYVVGMPITEAYWMTVKAANQPRQVLVQCFERRCLTYAPSNPANFQVEQANTGLQYFNWRYPKLPEDTTKPVISQIAIGEPTATSVTITWRTNEPATTEVRYGTTEELGLFQGDLTLTVDHSVTLTGLKPQQKYFFQVASLDRAGNRAISDADDFTTKAQSQAPVIGSVQVVPASNAATVTVVTDQPTTVEVVYWINTAVKTTVSSGDQAKMTHTVLVEDLQPATTYTYVVVASSASGQTTSPEASFTTAPPATTNPPTQ